MSQTTDRTQMQKLSTDTLIITCLSILNVKDVSSSPDMNIKTILQKVNSKYLKEKVNSLSTMKDKANTLYNFVSFYSTVTDMDGNAISKDVNHKPIEVQSFEENLAWDMRVHALNYHNSWRVRNQYFQNKNMEEWHEKESKIVNFIHSKIYRMNKKRKETETTINVRIIKQPVEPENTVVYDKRQKRCAAPKKVKRLRPLTSYRGSSDKKVEPQLRQRTAKLDCKRKLRQYYLENEE